MADNLELTITGRDRLSAKVHFMSERVDKLADKLDRLSAKRATPQIDVDVDKPTRKIGQFGDASSGVLSGALKIVSSNAIVMAAVVAAALAALPAAAALAATGIVLGFGGGLAGIGIMAAAQSKKVQKAFGGLKDHVVKQVKEMAAPFEPFLLHVAEVGRRVFDVFAKPLQDAFAKLAPTLTVLADQLGTAFEALAPAIGPVTDAFTAILRQLGPKLPDLFRSIGDSVRHVAEVVADNAVEFAGFLDFLLRLVPIAITATAKLAAFFAAVIRNAPLAVAGMLGAAETVLKGVRVLERAVLGVFGHILDGAVAAMGWVPGWGDKLRTAQANFRTFRDNVGDSLDGAIGVVEEFREAVDRMPKRIKLEGDIRDLEGKIAAAQERLKTVPKSKQTEVRAEIAQLLEELRKAKRALDALKDKTITVRVHFDTDFAAARRQHGGPLRAGQLAIVGEAGPELFVPDSPGTIIPNHQLPAAGGRGGVMTVNNYLTVQTGASAAQIAREIPWALKTSGY